MSNKVDLVPLIEWAIKRNAPETVRTRKKEDKPPNIGELIMIKRQELAALEAVMKDVAQMTKKEDKKDKWHEKMSTPQLAMILILVVPFYMSFVQKFLH